MKFITFFFSQSDHSKVVYIPKKGADMKQAKRFFFPAHIIYMGVIAVKF